MGLYERYENAHKFDEQKELIYFIKRIDERCGTMIFCGNKLPFYIYDIKPHEKLSISKVKLELLTSIGIECEIYNGYIVINKFVKINN